MSFLSGLKEEIKSASICSALEPFEEYSLKLFV